jgi:hypothetical protein
MTDRLGDELVSQSEFSPSVVQDGETLWRVGYAPEHMPDGELVPAAISHQDLAPRGAHAARGYSVDRASFSNVHNLRDLATRQMERSPARRQEAFVSSFPVKGIRNQTTETGARAFVVLDMSLRKNIGHASIYSAKRNPTPSEVKELKNLLLPFLRKQKKSFDVSADRLSVRYDTVEFRNFLSDKGLTPRELALKLDCNEKTISNIIYGRTAGPRGKMHRKICRILRQDGISEDQINKLFYRTAGELQEPDHAI